MFVLLVVDTEEEALQQLMEESLPLQALGESAPTSLRHQLVGPSHSQWVNLPVGGQGPGLRVTPTGWVVFGMVGSLLYIETEWPPRRGSRPAGMDNFVPRGGGPAPTEPSQPIDMHSQRAIPGSTLKTSPS